MSHHLLKRSMFLPVPLHVAWDFFSNPRNLEKITPPEMAFRILSGNLPDTIHEGLTIRYSVVPLAGLRMQWVSEITGVRAPGRFTDIQRKGPYAAWHHTHLFAQAPGGTNMEDLVEYRLPLGALGRLAHRWFVKKRLNDIFEYRTAAIRKLFPPAMAAS